MEHSFDRVVENLGNAIMLEHVNLLVPDQGVASEFYLVGLGLTRDPFMFPGTRVMWVNVGKNQFHLPSGAPQLLRGRVGLVTPDLKQLLHRLAAVRDRLKGTKFDFHERNDHVVAICPWGNQFRLYAPDPERFGPVNLGIAYVEFDVPVAAAGGIARFYRDIVGAHGSVEDNGDRRSAHIAVGPHQHLIFRETDGKRADYDGHHLQIYVQDFAGPHRRLVERGLLTEESDRFQYRFRDIIDLDSGQTLFTIEHEVRSMTHPLYARPLVNRNPEQSTRAYTRGADAWNWALSVRNDPGPPQRDAETRARARQIV